MRRFSICSTLVLALSTATVTACASAPLVGMPDGGPSTEAPIVRAPRRAAPPSTVAPTAGPVAVRWPVKTSAHVDLWLHAFALLEPDSASSPLYRRGYRDSMTVVKNRASLFTTLDRNAAFLSKGIVSVPSRVATQLLPLQVPSWDLLHNASERFVQTDGDTRGIKDEAMVAVIGDLSRLYPGAEDRSWFGSLVLGLDDEQRKFYADEHSRAERARARVVTAIDSLWQTVYRPRFARFLSNTNQASGDFILSLPVGVEGRVATTATGRVAVIVPFPDDVEHAPDAILVFAHEISAAVVREVATEVAASGRGADARSRSLTLAQIRAGSMLIEKVAPELLEPYMRLYLSSIADDSFARATGAPLREAFAKRFALPDAVASALAHQLDLILNGT